jgi:NIMA (never in mitosis gene a)-related kinase
MEFEKKYKKIQALGQGAYGKITKIINRKTREIAVLKEINLRNLNKKQKQDALNEVLILKSLNHPSILRYIDSICIDSNYLIKLL